MTPHAPDDSPPALWIHTLEQRLDERRRQGLFRTLRPVHETRDAGTLLRTSEPGPAENSATYIQFCTNNYLGLATHPEVIEAAREATAKFGAGAGASRLVAGSFELHHQLEQALARFKGTEAALLFPSGFMANQAALTTFAGPDDLIVSDKLNHASLLDSAHYSGAHHRTYPHRNLRRAEDLLTRGEGKTRWLVTDSVFSMDGDTANLAELCAIAKRTHALVLIDEAHATGVLGPRGAGLAELHNVESQVTLTVGTLSKALGSVGGFIAGPHAAIDLLINEGRPFIYTTALPPACSAAALAALEIVEREPQRRQRVLSLAQHLRNALTAMGFDCGNSTTPIIPVILGAPAIALAASEFLKSRGLYVPAIRPPTVPPNTARLRISLTATHTDAQIDQLISAMQALRAQHPTPPLPPDSLPS